jgi:hypothetical protein
MEFANITCVAKPVVSADTENYFNLILELYWKKTATAAISM